MRYLKKVFLLQMVLPHKRLYYTKTYAFLTGSKNREIDSHELFSKHLQVDL